MKKTWAVAQFLFSLVLDGAIKKKKKTVELSGTIIIIIINKIIQVQGYADDTFITGGSH